MKRPNIGWLYYKEYYSGLENAIRDNSYENGSFDIDLDAKNERIISSKLTNYDSSDGLLEKVQYKFSVKVKYPGLIMGIGASHIIKDKEELKLGMSFDHTTGLPYIPASSVKGLLRSYFPARLKAAGARYPEESRESKVFEKKANQLEQIMLKFLLPKSNVKPELRSYQLERLEKFIFEGKSSLQQEGTENIYGRDIFFDAFPVKSTFKGVRESDKERFLGIGAITPHGKDLLKDPNPIRFLKILPGVVFQFQFQLKDTQIDDITVSAFNKLLLFQHIISTFGLGAKTNVGFGRVEKVD